MITARTPVQTFFKREETSCQKKMRINDLSFKTWPRLENLISSQHENMTQVHTLFNFKSYFFI